MKKEYRVTAWHWEYLAPRFGKDDQIHFLTDAEVIAAIVEFGRAAIVEGDNGVLFLTFENGYD